MTVVPRPGSDSTVSVPPTRATRSRIPSSPAGARRTRRASASNPRPSSSTTADDLARRPLEDHAHPPGRGVLGDVRQRLLHDPVQGRLDRGGQAVAVQPGGLEVDLDPRPLGPPLGVVRQGRLQAEVVQRRGPELQGQVVDLPADQVGQGLQALEPVPGRGRVRGRVLDHLQPEAEGGQVLAHLVVQLAGDPPPLVLLGGRQPLLQVPPVRLRRSRRAISAVSASFAWASSAVRSRTRTSSPVVGRPEGVLGPLPVGDVADVALDDPGVADVVHVADELDLDAPAVVGPQRQVLVPDVPLLLERPERRLAGLDVAEQADLPQLLARPVRRGCSRAGRSGTGSRRTPAGCPDRPAGCRPGRSRTAGGSGSRRGPGPRPPAAARSRPRWPAGSAPAGRRPGRGGGR